MNFKAVLALQKTARSAQTHKSISFIWIVWSTLYVYLWFHHQIVYSNIEHPSIINKIFIFPCNQRLTFTKQSWPFLRKKKCTWTFFYWALKTGFTIVIIACCKICSNVCITYVYDTFYGLFCTIVFSSPKKWSIVSW